MRSPSAKVPDDLSLGDYELWAHNGTGGERGWGRAGSVAVAKPTVPWKEALFAVTEFGATPDDEADDSARRTISCGRRRCSRALLS
jgi:hypothetical protein